MPKIHPTALVDPAAQIANDVQIGAFCIVEADTTIGEGCSLESGAQVLRFTRLGRNNRIGKYTLLGGTPMDLKWRGEDTYLEIGDHNDIREFTTIHRGTAAGGGLTKVGSHNLITAYVHITHDCLVGDHNIIANTVQVAGHVEIGDYVRLGVTVAVHQFCRIGSHSIIGMMSKITRDILPFSMADGHPARHYTINKVGLVRDGFSAAEQQILHRAFKALRQKDAAAMVALESEPLAQRLFAFARAPSKRGLSSFA
ncbi:MAG: acyl-ACP--UDP-N-acetylglucosamine O-acyltransferase [Deinococcales bacterium]